MTQYTRQIRSSTALLLFTLCVVTASTVATTGAVAAADRPTAVSAAQTELLGSGTAQDPYEVSNATELQAMSDDLDAHYVLVDDVDASGTKSWDTGRGFDPIGDSDEAFTGTFDGQNHTVRGLTIRRSGDDWTGLFGRLGPDGRVEHVRLTDASVTGNNVVGGLAGQVDGTVEDVAVSGSVEGGNFVGGFAGKLEAGASVAQSSANAPVDGGTYVGGFTGSSNGASVSSVSAVGDVSGTETVGGLVGSLSDGAFQDVYATGSVSGSVAVGGLAGYMKESTLNGAYSAGSVDGETRVGGVVGSSDGGVDDVYWNGDVAGTDAAVDRDRSGAGFDTTELATDEMTGQSAATNMDALDTSTFWEPTAEYPVLESQVDAVSLSVPDQVIVDRPATATASVSLTDGRTVAVTGTADYSTNQSFLSVDGGVIDTSGTGAVEVTATVAGQSDSSDASVVTPPDISVDSRSLRYERVGTETAAPVDVTLDNDGGADGEFDVVLLVDGSRESTRTVTVPGHSTRSVQIDWSAPATGTYAVAVNGTEVGDLTVVDEPETSVAAATLSEELLAVGNATTVEATLQNAGDAAAGHTVELTANGDTVAARDVVVPADGTTVTVDYTAESTGEYDLAVDGADAGTLTVAEMGSVSVDDASVPDSVGAGESYEVTATVANSGGLALTAEVTYSVGGSAVATETVEVPADGTTVTFEATAPEDGESVEHVVSAGDAEWTGSSTVDVSTPESTATAESGGESDSGDSSEGDGDSSDDGSAETTSGDGVGFGVVAALCALLAAALSQRRTA